MATPTTDASKAPASKPNPDKPAPKGNTGKGGRGPRIALNEDAKIQLLVKENPKRAGSGAADRFSRYKQGMTVKMALEAGVRTDDIRWDLNHEFIKLA